VILSDKPNYGTVDLESPSRSKEGVCKGCAEEYNITRGPSFPSSVTKTSEILQLVHSDLSGMLPVTSLGGCSYYMTFTDDFSRKTWIF